jgi:hypothetical protein
MIDTLFEIKSKSGEIIATNLPPEFVYNSVELIGRIGITTCPISGNQMRHGYFESENGKVYLASYSAPTNKIFRRYFEACEFFIPTLVQSVDVQKNAVKQNFRRFKHNLVTHHTNIIQQLESTFPIDTAEKGIHNQIEFVQKILADDPKEAAVAILKVIKSANLMKSEFDVYDMLSSDKPLLEFYYHNPHKLVLLVLNPFWLEFIERGIRIDVRECGCEILVDYKSIAVVFSHMFENTSKYSASDSTLRISFVENPNSVTIVFDMISLKINPEEKDRIFDEEFSGEYAKGLALAGNGIGMSIVKNLLALNKSSIELDIDTDPASRKTIMGIPFEKNIFKITLPKRGV